MVGVYSYNIAGEPQDNLGLSVFVEQQGGTNQSSYTTGDILYSDTTDSLAKLAIGSNTEVLTIASGIPSWAASAGGGDPNVILTTVGGTTYLQASTTANAWLFNTGFVSQASSTIDSNLTITGTTTLDTTLGIGFTFSPAHGSGILFTETNAVFNSIDSMGFFADTDADGGGNYFPSLQLIIGSTKGIDLTLNDTAGASNFRILDTGSGVVFVVDSNGNVTTGAWEGTGVGTLFGGTGVSVLDDIVGTSNQITVSGGAATIIAGDVTLSLPSTVIITSLIAQASSTIVGDLTVTGVINFGGASSFEIVNASAPTVDATGEIALDTTDNQLLIADSGGTARVFATAERVLLAFTIASTSADFISGGSFPIPAYTKDGRELTQFRCSVDGGTSVVVNLSDSGTNDTETITCATTQTSDTDVATNDTFTADELWRVEIGTITGTVDYLTFEAYGYITRE